MLRLDRRTIAFTTGNSLGQYVVMPFGFCNGPATFEPLTDNLLGVKPSPVYLDDVIAHAVTFEVEVEHLEHLFGRQT